MILKSASGAGSIELALFPTTVGGGGAPAVINLGSLAIQGIIVHYAHEIPRMIKLTR